MRRQRARALLIDFDGVLRRWDPAVVAGVEQRSGLATGALLDTAMHWSRLRPVVTGEISHEQWLADIAGALAEAAGGPQRARAAVHEWAAYRGEVDPEVLEFVRAVRAAGLPVGLATNATDWLDADLAALKLTDEVDVVINSSVLGIHKPAPEFFERACAAVDVAPHWVLFVDDDDRAVRGARAGKLPAFRWTGPQDLPYLRAALQM